MTPLPDHARIAAWRAVGASVQGTAHAARGLPCQDAQVVCTLPGGHLVLAVADGAGSAARGAEGAQTAALAAIGFLAAQLAQGAPDGESGWTALLSGACRAAAEEICVRARAERTPLREYATTLICAVAAPDWLAVAQIGDGFVIAETEDDKLFLAAHPQRGEYANEAYFLTMDGALDYVDVRVWQVPVRALLASTDGLLRLALRLPENEPHQPFFRPLADFAASIQDASAARAELVRFLSSARLCARTDDDKTLVAAARRPAWGLTPDAGSLLLAAPAGDDESV